MKMGVSLPLADPDSSVTPIGAARILEERAYESLWVFGESVASLSLVVAATRQLRIGTSIAELIRGGPALITDQVASLDKLSGGRFMLGHDVEQPFAHALEMAGRGEGWMVFDAGMEPRAHTARISDLRRLAAESGLGQVPISFCQRGMPRPQDLDQCDDLRVDRHISILHPCTYEEFERYLDELARV